MAQICTALSAAIAADAPEGDYGDLLTSYPEVPDAATNERDESTKKQRWLNINDKQATKKKLTVILGTHAHK